MKQACDVQVGDMLTNTATQAGERVTRVAKLRGAKVAITTDAMQKNTAIIVGDDEWLFVLAVN